MPLTPVAVLEPEHLKLAVQRLCGVFDVKSLHPHQEEAGQNILRGVSTLLDVPTGGGKTVVFCTWANVGFVGPEMVLSTQFHEKVLNEVAVTKNIICLVIDELHCVWEWGNNDFRPEYPQIVQLLTHLPTGLSILGASATVPYHVIKDILENLGPPADCARVETLVYGNGRQDIGKIQDFLRDNVPPSIDPKKAFEFYHRHIDDKQKESIQTRLKSGELRGVSATDALGLGMDFQTIMRVLLWIKPLSFLSLVQKIGCCAMYMRCCAELEISKTEKEAAGKEDSVAGSDEEENLEDPPNRDHALALQDASDEEEEAAPVERRRKGKGKPKILSPMEERDQRYFLEYIARRNAADLCGINTLGIIEKVLKLLLNGHRMTYASESLRGHSYIKLIPN
ncbi:hypothetical protein C8F04DRAFT_1323299 [Mycena alexandri]|uniref:DNA 3'-5' helicase n=1 Tax=Mycena alexandri TaxID=1745969 RepID=A0AAD6XBK3_9AGAR|nr:hypothetical protein C8F04DRAFT_1323299 [Mycena alexandri]